MMQPTQSELQNIAKNAVGKFAPNELPLFDEVWTDLSDEPDTNVRMAEQQHGAGTELSAMLVTSVIIPLTLYLGKGLIDRSLNLVFDWIKKRSNGNIPDEQARDLAEYMVNNTTGDKNNGKVE